MNVYKYDEITKEYTGVETAQLDPLESKVQGKEVYLLPANATFTAPLVVKEGYTQVFKDGVWNYVEDNRGKEYWLPEDEYGTPARIMNELGEFPEGAIFEAPEKPFEHVKAEKVAEMKAERDRIQELPIEYNGKSFDYNKESLQKLNEAKDCLEGTEEKQIWICADNTLTYLNYNDIMAIKRLGKERSNNVHIQYAKLKYLIEMAKTAEEVEAITFETDTSTIPLEV